MQATHVGGVALALFGAWIVACALGEPSFRDVLILASATTLSAWALASRRQSRAPVPTRAATLGAAVGSILADMAFEAACAPKEGVGNSSSSSSGSSSSSSTLRATSAPLKPSVSSFSKADEEPKTQPHRQRAHDFTGAGENSGANKTAAYVLETNSQASSQYAPQTSSSASLLAPPSEAPWSWSTATANIARSWVSQAVPLAKSEPSVDEKDASRQTSSPTSSHLTASTKSADQSNVLSLGATVATGMAAVAIVGGLSAYAYWTGWGSAASPPQAPIPRLPIFATPSEVEGA